MRVLFCCETYHPARGGVQEVMRQVAERMVLAGHDVTVATGYLPERDFTSYNGVKVRDFKVAGNAVSGIEGEADRYRDFVRGFDGDAILIKAAQQWTFDALWPVLDEVKARKVFIPCGFSAFYEEAYKAYFAQLPDVLRKFDHLIFYAEKYRDIDFARAHGLTNYSILPNGASELEFDAPPEPGFRHRLGIPDDAFVLLTVGSPISTKGHIQVAEAFCRLKIGRQPATLILNSNWPIAAGNAPMTTDRDSGGLEESKARGGLAKLKARAKPLLINAAWGLTLAARIPGVLRRGGWAEVMARAKLYLRPYLMRAKRRGVRLAGRIVGPRRGVTWANLKIRAKPYRDWLQGKKTIDEWIWLANAQAGKRVLCTDLPRADLVQALMTADIFVFASIVEYSPLVLFEAVAAGTPFLSVPVGNAEEIARWTVGGMICPAPKDERGYTRVDPAVLAREMGRCMGAPDMLARIGAAGKESWRRSFTWQAIAPQYEAILSGRTSGEAPPIHWGGQSRSAMKSSEAEDG